MSYIVVSWTRKPSLFIVTGILLVTCLMLTRFIIVNRNRLLLIYNYILIIYYLIIFPFLNMCGKINGISSTVFRNFSSQVISNWTGPQWEYFPLYLNVARATTGLLAYRVREVFILLLNTLRHHIFYNWHIYCNKCLFCDPWQ